MSSFTKALRVAHTSRSEEGRMLAVVTSPLCFYVGEDLATAETTFTVKPGFISDGTSGPRLLWGLYPPWGPYAAAAVLHDFLYFMQDGKQAEADKLYYVASQVLGMPKWQAQGAWAALRVFGRRGWDSSLQRYQRRVDTVLKNLRPEEDADIIASIHEFNEDIVARSQRVTAKLSTIR